MDDPEPTQRPAITQEMIALFDDYTHLSLDRRKFLDHLAALAGSTTAAVTIAGLMASNAQAAGLTAEDDPKLAIETVTYPGAKGKMTGYQATPREGGSFPAVIVIHENRGLNPHIKDTARRVALEADFSPSHRTICRTRRHAGRRRRGAQYVHQPQPGRRRGQRRREHCLLEDPAEIDRQGRRDGVLLGRWGGQPVGRGVAVDLLAGVAYYGQQPKAEDVPENQSQADAALCRARRPDRRRHPGVQDAPLDAAKVDYQLFMYDGANHAFNNDTSSARYDKAAAELAWSRTMAFFRTRRWRELPFSLPLVGRGQGGGGPHARSPSPPTRPALRA